MSARQVDLVFWVFTFTMMFGVLALNCLEQKPSRPVPKMSTLTSSYEALIEISILDQNYTTALDELLDYEGQRASMTIHGEGNAEKLIFSYSTNEVFDITDENCKVFTVDNNQYNFLYATFANKSDTDKRLDFGSASLLRYVVNHTNEYYGQGQVRGIPADIWLAYICLPNNQGTFNATSYFSEIGWNTYSPLLQVPLRVEVEGMATDATISGSAAITKQNNSKYFHRIYDFIYYTPHVKVDSSQFLTPPEGTCLHRKNTKDVPKFASNFKYTAEIIDASDSYTTHYAIWYNLDHKLVREDTRKMALLDGETSDTLTEIHDFNTDVSYVIDHAAGCTVKPINTTFAYNRQDGANFQFNESNIVNMPEPNVFLFLNYNYTYAGQQTVRGITCDIFSAFIPDYYVQGVKINATFEYAFATEHGSDLPLNDLKSSVQKYPIQLLISAKLVDYERVYNFFDFTQDDSTYPTFDVSSCFGEEQKLRFLLTFPGSLMKGTWEQLTASVYTTLIETIHVNPIRIGGITLTSDDDNIYASSYVIASASSAQFVKKDITLEYENDKLIKGIMMTDECAALCVDNTDFTCEGFQYCPDNGHACRLSTSHSPTGSVTQNATACNNFARTIEIALKKEPLLKEVYLALEAAVYQGNVHIVITDGDNVSTTFTAVSVTLLSGEIVQNKSLPSLPSAFFYRLEIVVSTLDKIEETYVWYDQDMNLVRYDNRDPESDTPVLTTHIHDFGLGVAYLINKVTMECTVAPIASSEVFDVTVGTTTRNGGLTVSMKSSQSLFFLDDTYTYVGQGTARGILCDVYESTRNDFDLEHFNMSNQESVFKYYFQADGWNYISPQATASVHNQPIQLHIEDKSSGALLTYNFYDFTEQHFASSFYDASSCYSSDERKNFVIAFKNQAFHPFLDELSNTFLNIAVMKLAELTYMSSINFQGTSVTYDDNGVYIIATILGHTSSLNLFTPVMKVAHNKTSSQIFALTAEDCAAACTQISSYICNSFDYCQETSDSNCVLGIRHDETEGDPSISTGLCMHYSRTENGTYPGLSVKQIYDTISDYIYDDKFEINLTLLNGTDVLYKATDINDDILLPNDPGSLTDSLLQKFAVTPQYQLSQSLVTVVHNMVTLSDCALLCLQENTFNCQAFDYQFSIGTCRLSAFYPDEFSTNITKNNFTYLYSRFYTAEYTKYNAEVFGTHPAKIISNALSGELCARACTDNSDFRCESFEICNDGTCRLRKTHILEARPTDITQNPDCVHYSRNHLFDYIRRDNKIIEDHDDNIMYVSNASECAVLCARGDGLPLCASFEVCQKQLGEITCTLSVADPTVDKNVIIEKSLECSLYTRANSQSGGSSPTVPSKSETSTSVTSIHGSSPTVPSKSETSTSLTSRHGSNPTVSSTSGTSPAVTSRYGTSPAVTSRYENECTGKSESSDTGARFGIAFGTLILGLITGAASVFGFLRFRALRSGNHDDATVLQTYTD